MGIAKYFINTIISGVVAGGVYYYLDKKSKNKNSSAAGATESRGDEANVAEVAPDSAGADNAYADEESISDEAHEAIDSPFANSVDDDADNGCLETDDVAVDINRKIEEMTFIAKDKASRYADKAKTIAETCDSAVKEYKDVVLNAGLDAAEKVAVTVMEKSLDARRKLAESKAGDVSAVASDADGVDTADVPAAEPVVQDISNEEPTATSSSPVDPVSTDAASDE